MDPRNLDYNAEGPSDVWDELTYTEARALHDEDAKELVIQIIKLANQSETIFSGQYKCWRQETIAQALIGYRNYLLDRMTTRFEQILVRTLQDAGVEAIASSTRYTKYFSKPRSQVIGMALEGQLRFMRPWLELLKQEKEQALLDFVPSFEEMFASGQRALGGLIEAQAATATHREQQINQLFTDANSARRSLYGKLVSVAEEKGLSQAWPDSFFRREERRKKKPEELKREALLAMFGARAVALSREGRQQIQGEKDSQVLDRWIARVTTITREEELFTP
jgi:hypothetical protein